MAGTGWPDHAHGRHAAAKRSFLNPKTVRFRTRKVVPAAAIAAALAAGATAYALVGTGTGTPGASSAKLATVPSGGYTVAAGDVLAAAGPGTMLAAGPGKSQSSATKSAAARGAARPAASSPRRAARSSAAPAASSPAASSPAASSPAVAPANAVPRSSATAPAVSRPATTSLACNTSDGLLPDNVTEIVRFLLAHGYSGNAAAGIAGNIYQESKGDPESVGSGGGGLIGWTPLPGGFVTGDAAADLQTQLSAVLAFNEQWAQYLPALNDAATPADAAYIYVTDFERAGIPAAATREAAAEDVASACGI